MKSNKPKPTARPAPAPRRAQNYQVEEEPTNVPPSKPPRSAPQHLSFIENVTEHSGSDRPPTPAGWESKYWHQVTDPKLMQRAARRVAHSNEYYGLAKFGDLMCIMCFLLLVVLVIVVGNIPRYL